MKPRPRFVTSGEIFYLFFSPPPYYEFLKPRKVSGMIFSLLNFGFRAFRMAISKCHYFFLLDNGQEEEEDLRDGRGGFEKWKRKREGQRIGKDCKG